ncbi:D-alanyl-D-alanine carboxypeptidase family protein [Stappia indica]|uniref:D-alanyl-D-alanine carboxypeptidase family protein n=1 Tax=Stappia indica TaxID=538381 RepID=UPI001CD3264F|nr:D-alanyl-D-alanine carboxypeptidase family protein [Stappia indica]MCA1296857.1 D-alanyl-D-alanine carboxypeptidase [Stappia indica]
MASPVAAGAVQTGQTSDALPDVAAAPENAMLAASAVGTAPRAPGPASLALAPSGGAVARAHSAIVIDARSGKVLHEEDADGLRNPASLSKMMTLYLLFDALDAGIVTLDSPLTVSRKAASQPPARIGVKAGTTITVDQAIRALAVKSANDVAVVVAENIGGTETAFAHRMTRKARSLGMRRTNFVNASGLENPGQVTTARDMATLARALKRNHARRARNFTARSFTYNGRTYKTTNNLLGRVAGVDGIKTGYISKAGYNLAASARRGGKSIIAVVIGGQTEAKRDREVTNLLERYL